MPYRPQTNLEENVNAITHGLGVLLCLIATPFLFLKSAKHDNTMMLWGISLFSFGMLAVYLSSTIYHALRNPKPKKIAQVLDHISIFFLIGGTYAPIILQYVPEGTAKIFLAVQWAIILAGAVLKLFFTGKYEWMSVTLYITLGWMLVFVLDTLMHTMPATILYWIIGGGIAYTCGVFFYLQGQRKYAHNVWHVFVLAGTIMHFVAVYKSLDVKVVF